MSRNKLEEPILKLNEEGQLEAIARGRGSEMYWPKEKKEEHTVVLELPEREYTPHFDTNNGIVVIEGPKYTGTKTFQIVHKGQGEGHIPDIIK